MLVCVCVCECMYAYSSGLLPSQEENERPGQVVDWFISGEHDMVDALQKRQGNQKKNHHLFFFFFLLRLLLFLLLLNFNDKKPRSIWNNRGVRVCAVLAKPDVCTADDGHSAP